MTHDDGWLTPTKALAPGLLQGVICQRHGAPVRPTPGFALPVAPQIFLRLGRLGPSARCQGHGSPSSKAVKVAKLAKVECPPRLRRALDVDVPASGTQPCTPRGGQRGPIALSLIDTHVPGFRVVRRRARLRAAMAFFFRRTLGFS